MKIKKFSLEKQIAAYFIVVVLIISSIALLSLRINDQNRQNKYWVSAAEKLLLQLNGLEALLKDLVIESRAFVITGDARFLNQAANLEKKINKDVAALSTLLKEPEQQERFSHLKNNLEDFQRKRKELTSLRINEHLQSTKLANSMVTVNSQLDLLKNQLGQIKSAQTRLLDNRKKEYQQTIQNAAQFVRILILTFIISLFVAFLIIFRSIRKKNRAEAALIKSKTLLDNIISHAPVLVSVKDLNGRFILTNSQFAQALQTTQEALQGNTNTKFLDPENVKKLTQEDAQVIRTQKPSELQIVLSAADGPHTYIASKFPLYDDKGQLYAIGSTSADITPIVKAHKALEESYALQQKFLNGLQLVLSSSSDLICVISESGQFVQISDTSLSLFGYTAKEMMQKYFMDYVWEQDKPRTTEVFAMLKSGKKVIDFSNHYVTKRGQIIPIIWSAFWVEQDRLLYCVARDGTKQKRTEEQLAQSRSSLLNAQKIARLGSWEWDIKNDRFTGSDELYHLLKIETTTKIDFRDLMSERIHPEDRNMMSVILKNALKNGKKIDVEHRIVHADGEICHMRSIGEVVSDKTGQPVWLSGTMQDITERKKTEEAVHQSEEQRKLIMSAAIDSIVCTDGSGSITFWNPQAEKAFGWRSDEVQGRQLSQLIFSPHLKEALDEGLNLFLKTGKSAWVNALLELEAMHKDGHQFPVEISIIPILQDNAQSFCAFIRDISERKKAQEMLRHLNESLEKRAEELQASNSELERFAYVASHDLQEPLRMVSSFLTLLEKRLSDKLDETSKQYIDFAVDGAERMKQLIQDLLQYSRLGSVKEKSESVDLNEVLQNTLRTFGPLISETKVGIIIAQLPVVYGNKVQLSQVFQNLIGNAIKYRNGLQPLIEINAKEEPTCWLFSVKDNGIGIAPKFHDKIFTIFQRLHSKAEYSGTGIGLTIAKKVIEQHGGKIWLDSEPGKGATFFFTIKKRPYEQRD